MPKLSKTKLLTVTEAVSEEEDKESAEDEDEDPASKSKEESNRRRVHEYPTNAFGFIHFESKGDQLVHKPTKWV